MRELVSPPRSACRSSTLAHRRRAVERVIRAMSERLDEPLPLRALARIALLSPYHFNRVFRQVTGLPPAHFLTALRLQEAKRRLLATERTVTDVCFDVGYTSLGSFISRFTHLVGRSPRHVRALGRHAPAACAGPECGREYAPAGVAGVVSCEAPFAGAVAVGLFPTPLPAGRPAGCALLAGPGAYHITGIPDGEYYAMAVGLPDPAGGGDDALCENTPRARAGPLAVRGATGGPVVADLVLRPPAVTDPPVLVALPFFRHLLSSTRPDCPGPGRLIRHSGNS